MLSLTNHISHYDRAILAFKATDCIKLLMDKSVDKSTLPIIPQSEFRKANTREKCYIAMNNYVYDVTDFLVSDHPGGYAVLLKGGGKDVTEDFRLVNHSLRAQQMTEKYLIGRLSTEPETKQASGASSDTSPRRSMIVAPGSASSLGSNQDRLSTGNKERDMAERNKQKEALKNKINRIVKLVVGGAIVACIAGFVYYKWPASTPPPAPVENAPIQTIAPLLK